MNSPGLLPAGRKGLTRVVAERFEVCTGKCVMNSPGPLPAGRKGLTRVVAERFGVLHREVRDE